MKIPSLFLTLASFLCIFELIGACPSVCQCIGVARVSVYCDYKGLSEVPDNIPPKTTHLYFMGNKFTRVLPEMFLGNEMNSDGTPAGEKVPLKKLKLIRLDLNPLPIVNEHAFNSLPALEMIFLPSEVKIQRQAFAEMKLDKETFDGFIRVPTHPLEDPNYVAFSKYEPLELE